MKSIIVLVCSLFFLAGCGGKDKHVEIDQAHLASNKAKVDSCIPHRYNCVDGFISIRNKKGDILVLKLIDSVHSHEWDTIYVGDLHKVDDEILDRSEITLLSDPDWSNVAASYKHQLNGP